MKTVPFFNFHIPNKVFEMSQKKKNTSVFKVNYSFVHVVPKMCVLVIIKKGNNLPLNSVYFTASPVVVQPFLFNEYSVNS